jgi:hypothetical protein
MLTIDILSEEDILLMRLKYPDTYLTTPTGFGIEYMFIEFYNDYLELNNILHSDEELWEYFNDLFNEDWIEYLSN